MGGDARVVVTGIGLLSALGSDPGAVLRAMVAGRSGIRAATRFPLAGLSSRLAGEVPAADRSAALAAGGGATYDEAALYAAFAGRRAVADAGLSAEALWGGGAGLALGTCNGGIRSLEAQWRLEALDPERTAHYPFYRQGEDTARLLGLGGPVVTVTTACTAGGSAIGLAVDLLRGGHAEVMLAGGTDPLARVVYAGFHALRALSPSPCVPYGQPAGLSLGEGAALLVLEPLERARERGARIYAEILGYGLSDDGYHATAGHPEGAGLAAAVAMALAAAGLRADDVAYVNAHGTGTLANDAPELRGLARALGPAFARTPVSSSKGSFGHALGAAAAMEFATSVAAVGRGLLPALPPSAPREGCEAADLVRGTPRPTRAKVMLKVNSAFGGHNCAILSRVGAAPEEPGPGGSGTPAGQGRIAVVGRGLVAPAGCLRGALLDRLPTAPPAGGRCGFVLKDAWPALYERRMNPLVQFCLGAARQALDDAAWEPDGVGLLLGTARGSLQSTARYLGSVYRDGPASASAIDFPYMVHNSALGKLAEKLGLRGFGASFCTGGHEGLAGLLYATERLRQGAPPRCLVGAADERSPLDDAIDEAEGLGGAACARTEGACFLALAAEDDADGPPLAYVGGSALVSAPAGGAAAAALERALARAGVPAAALDFVLLQVPARPGEADTQRHAVCALCPEVPVADFGPQVGYAPSMGSLLHVWLAIDLLRAADGDPLAAARRAGLDPWARPRRGVAAVASVGIGGQGAATVMLRP